MGTVTVEPIFIIGLTVLILLILVANVYIVVYLQHPEDPNESYLAKCVVLLGLQLCALSILFLPVDAANDAGFPGCDRNSFDSSSAFCGGVDTHTMWKALLSMTCVVYIVLIPFATFYYDCDYISNEVARLEANKTRFRRAVCRSGMLMLLAGGLTLTLYFMLNDTAIPVAAVQGDVNDMQSVSYLTTGGNPFSLQQASSISYTNSTQHTTEYITFPLEYPVYCIAVCGWLGWWIFCVFAGVGLVVLPLELIQQYVGRAGILSADELLAKERDIREHTAELLEITSILQRSRESFAVSNTHSSTDKRQRALSDRLEVNKLTQCVYHLEKQTEHFRNCKKNRKNYNPYVPVAMLVCGCCCGIISCCWILHIALYMLPKDPLSLFLNEYFIWFDNWFPMFGAMSYGLFALYLEACTVTGCFKVGLRLPLLKIHPVALHNTFMNSFLFNVGLILICTIPTIHFCLIAFTEYALYSDAFLMFQVEIQHLKYFSIFNENHVFVWLLTGCALATVVTLLVSPSDLPPTTVELKAHLQRQDVDYHKQVKDIKSCNAVMSKTASSDDGKGDQDGNGDQDGEGDEKTQEELDIQPATPVKHTKFNQEYTMVFNTGDAAFI